MLCYSKDMRTTVDLPPPLLKYAKDTAHEMGVRLSDVLADALVLYKSKAKQTTKTKNIELPVFTPRKGYEGIRDDFPYYISLDKPSEVLDYLEWEDKKLLYQLDKS